MPNISFEGMMREQNLTFTEKLTEHRSSPCVAAQEGKRTTVDFDLSWLRFIKNAVIFFCMKQKLQKKSPNFPTALSFSYIFHKYFWPELAEKNFLHVLFRKHQKD